MAGWPFRDAMLALPIRTSTSMYAHLRSLVEGGFGKRIVFGSDFPSQAADALCAP
jgi:hypothetical protein